VPVVLAHRVLDALEPVFGAGVVVLRRMVLVALGALAFHRVPRSSEGLLRVGLPSAAL
jgi:hypothetical protein